MVSPYPVYPIGLAHLAGVLQEAGHVVHHVDILADGNTKRLQQLLTKKSFDIIGVSIRNIDNVDSSNSQGLLGHIEEVIQIARNESQAPIVLGGPGFSIMPEVLLAHLDGDYGVVGEGELAFPQLIDRIMSGEPIKEKLLYGSITSDPWCQPVFYDSTAGYYLKHGGMLSVQTKRGCYHNCSYCSYPTIEGKRMRYRDPRQVAEEVHRLVREHQARYIFFTDGVFNDEAGHYLRVAEELIRADNRIPWCAFFRPQNLSRKELTLLKKSGLSSMELGTDGASDTTIGGLNKGFTFDEVIAINEYAVSESIPCAHFIMFGGPDETEETVNEGLDNISRLPESVVFAYAGIRIFPGTGLHKRAIKDRIISRDLSLLNPVFYFSPQVTQEYIEKKLCQSFKGRIDRIFLYGDLGIKINALHMMGHDGPLWDKLLLRKQER